MLQKIRYLLCLVKRHEERNGITIVKQPETQVFVGTTFDFLAVELLRKVMKSLYRQISG